MRRMAPRQRVWVPHPPAFSAAPDPMCSPHLQCPKRNTAVLSIFFPMQKGVHYSNDPWLVAATRCAAAYSNLVDRFLALPPIGVAMDDPQYIQHLKYRITQVHCMRCRATPSRPTSLTPCPPAAPHRAPATCDTRAACMRPAKSSLPSPSQFPRSHPSLAAEFLGSLSTAQARLEQD